MENKEQETPRPVAVPAGVQGRGPAGAGAPRRARRGFAPRRKICRLCAEHVTQVDFKQIQLVKSFCSESGKILSRRITGACAGHQRQIMRAVKINRNLALMSYDA